ncbi:hypothetical protein Poly51_36300 [Rubripirellula tenax]|uniref:Uncharacterized protein n=1 Tax=Rubripirellula tenax TaxID=2528015 RepID=A0A5C6F0J0_9BACT|nr:hypothetical protein [Rubripirellula tenax]TWU54908.1 hypothetical protein Poly51_36300 [Rubripirellula tenax]
MADERTAEVADNMSGDKLYQQRARLALPLLVRYAFAQRVVTYEELARQLEMPNARNLNYVLGSIGVTLAELGDRWVQPIPRIALLVVNKSTGMPGRGVDALLTESLESLTKHQREALINETLATVFAYTHWLKVLAELELPPPPAILPELVEEARRRGGGGESEQHRLFKEAIAANPRLVGLPASLSPGTVEFALPSGDVVDVMFRKGSVWIAVEVKSSISDGVDLTRGLFQCVKYDAVLKAWRSTQSESADIRVILALQSALPTELFDLKSALGIEVVDEIALNLH